MYSWVHGRHGYLHHLLVMPDYRRQGIAQAMKTPRTPRNT
ncbi:GNAT family N-acetyltransferase [Pseudomonas sp. 2995-3]